MSDKLTKFFAVVFLTLLIWTWAFLSQGKDEDYYGTLNLSTGIERQLFVSFAKYDQTVPLELTFKGSPDKISELSRNYRAAQNDPDKERFDYYFNPADQGYTKAGIYTLDLLDYLRKNNKTRELALSLESVKPEQIEVQVELLVKKRLPVQCLDEIGTSLKPAEVEPAWVEMYVKEGYLGSAYIALSPQQIELARQKAIQTKPYVEVGSNIRYSETEVTVNILKADALGSRVYQPQRIGFLMSPSLQEKYKVELENETELRGTIQVRATDEALKAYENMRYQLLIEIRDDDAALAEIPPREVIYNFPAEYIKNGQIELVESGIPKTARIKLISITPAPMSP